VGGEPSPEQREVVEGSVHAIEYMVQGVKPGMTIDDLFQRGQTWMRENGWLGSAEASGKSGLGEGPLHSYMPIFGHGIGVSIEKPWIVAGESTVIEKNMTLAIELMLARGTIGANFEHDVLITDDGCEILDIECPKWWWK
jgi:Xaa-Pro aminopeptidase